MSESFKYTDQDVRQNPDFYGIVVNYLVDYSGEFQFLIDCKMRIASNMDLTVGMVRGVLNCMRVDPRVKDLPEPMEWPEDVIPIDKSYRRPKKRRKIPCTRTDYHSHRYEDWDTYEYCPGKYEYNRTSYQLSATVHPEYVFVKGKSAATKTVHLVTKAEVIWYPERNVAGFIKEPELIIHTACRYPYYLRNPKLLTVDIVKDNQEELYRCGYCMPKDISHEWR